MTDFLSSWTPGDIVLFSPDRKSPNWNEWNLTEVPKTIRWNWCVRRQTRWITRFSLIKDNHRNAIFNGSNVSKIDSLMSQIQEKKNTMGFTHIWYIRYFWSPVCSGDQPINEVSSPARLGGEGRGGHARMGYSRANVPFQQEKIVLRCKFEMMV